MTRYWKECDETLYLPSQCSPVYSSKHWHWYPNLPDRHRPLEEHGFDEQKSISTMDNSRRLLRTKEDTQKQTFFTSWTCEIRRTYRQTNAFIHFSLKIISCFSLHWQHVEPIGAEAHDGSSATNGIHVPPFLHVRWLQIALVSISKDEIFV